MVRRLRPTTLKNYAKKYRERSMIPKSIEQKQIPKRAMILAAGLGLRMRPITCRIPKPMVHLAGRPLLSHALERLEAVGVTDVVINIFHFADQIERYYKNYKGASITFSRETHLLDTGGGVKLALSMLGQQPFFVINGDAFWLNGPSDALARLAKQWSSSQMDALLMLHSTVDAYGYDGVGDFHCKPDGKLIRRAEQEVSPWLFSGVQILDPDIMLKAPNGAFSLNSIYDQALERDRLYGMIHDGELFHVGTPESLEKTEQYLKTAFAETKRR